MVYYTDTNAMWRRFVPDDPRHLVVKVAMDTLLRQGVSLAISAQNLIEFHALATRPAEVNGLGLTNGEARTKANAIETFFAMLPDTAAVYPYWRSLVDKYEVKGKQVHDTRLVAVMLTHGITHLLQLHLQQNPVHNKARLILETRESRSWSKKIPLGHDLSVIGTRFWPQYPCYPEKQPDGSSDRCTRGANRCV